jgi:hypothetical protein
MNKVAPMHKRTVLWFPNNRVTSASKCGRGACGQSLIELAAGLIIFVAIFTFLVDAACLAIGACYGQNVCMEAARAASIGDPGQDGQTAKSKARRIIEEADKNKGGIIGGYTLDQVQTLNIVRPPSRTGGIGEGTVVVDSSVTVAPPFLLRALGGPVFQFHSQQSFPFSFAVAASKTGE